MQCPEDLPRPDPAQSNAAGWWLFAIAAAIIVIDVVLDRTGHETMSRWVKRRVKPWRWWKAFGIGVIGLTLFHLLFGGPL